MSEILNNAKNRAELHKLYDEALKSGAESFEFKGHTILVSYAKYLLQFLDKVAT
jgi:hypothetical protein